VKLSEHQQNFTKDLVKLNIKAEELGIGLTLGDGYRSQEQQEIYFKTKKTRTLKSNHLKRLAQDYNFFINGNLTYKHPLIFKLGEYWESLNKLNRWGGNFKGFYDGPHFERNV